MKLDITQDFYKALLEKALGMKIEERDLALDRYRAQDETIETPDDFILQGKNAVSFLKLGADCSNDILSIAKEIKGIVFDKTEKSTTNVVIDDSVRQAILEAQKGFDDIDED